jgi:hypothetical protein
MFERITITSGKQFDEHGTFTNILWTLYTVAFRSSILPIQPRKKLCYWTATGKEE